MCVSRNISMAPEYVSLQIILVLLGEVVRIIEQGEGFLNKRIDISTNFVCQLARKDEEISLIDQQLKEQCSIAKHEGDRANLFKEQCEAVQRSHDELQEELATVKDQLFDFQGTIKTSNKVDCFASLQVQQS